MGAELGATTSMFPADERMDVYLRATGRGDLVPIVERYRDMLAPDAGGRGASRSNTTTA